MAKSKNTSSKGKSTGARKAKRWNARQRIGLAVGAVGAFVLLLSVWECTAALSRLTGMPLMLSALLAIGIDLGMVVSEMAAVVSARDTDAHRWASRYILLAVALSVILNAVAAASHASGWMMAVAAPVGGVVPLLVYISGRSAGALYTGK